METLVDFSKTDNGQAVSILLQDGRCDASVDHLEKMSEKSFT